MHLNFCFVACAILPANHQTFHWKYILRRCFEVHEASGAFLCFAAWSQGDQSVVLSALSEDTVEWWESTTLATIGYSRSESWQTSRRYQHCLIMSHQALRRPARSCIHVLPALSCSLLIGTGPISVPLITVDVNNIPQAVWNLLQRDRWTGLSKKHGLWIACPVWSVPISDDRIPVELPDSARSQKNFRKLDRDL